MAAGEDADSSAITLTDSDVRILLESGVLNETLKDVEALRTHLDRCRNGDVHVRVVDMADRLVYETHMKNMGVGSSGAPTVGKLRSLLKQHFRSVEETYHAEVREAIFPDKYCEDPVKASWKQLGGITQDFIDKDRLIESSYRPAGSSGPSSAFGRRHFFPVEGTTFHSSSLNLGPFVGEFYFPPMRFLGESSPKWVCFLLRDPRPEEELVVAFRTNPALQAFFDVYDEDLKELTDDYADEQHREKSMGGSFVHVLELKHELGAWVENPPGVDIEDFSPFAHYVADAASGDTLEMVLDAQLFISQADLDAHPDLTAEGGGLRLPEGVPWTVKFSSFDAKYRFVDLCQALAIGQKIDKADRQAAEARQPFGAGWALQDDKNGDPDDDDNYNRFGASNFGFRVRSIVARILDKATILDRLPEPHRTAFDNNNWWHLTRNCEDLEFVLMAAESPQQDENKILSKDAECSEKLVDLVGAPEAQPDVDEGKGERRIQLRITTQGAALLGRPAPGPDSSAVGMAAGM